MDNLLFVILPYAALLLAVASAARRYVVDGFSYSSLSSQFLESRELFYGSVAWHTGIAIVLTGHLVGFLFPGSVLRFNAAPVRLYILESAALLFGLMALVGVVGLVLRRASADRVRVVTTPMDAIVLFFLLVQVALGAYIGIFHRWGSSWYAALAVPYLRSLLTLHPAPELVAPLPMIVKVHIVNAYVLTALFGFSRLVHIVVFPVRYLWRPYQLVIWNRVRGRAANRAFAPIGAPKEV